MNYFQKFARMPDDGLVGMDVAISYAVNENRDIVYAWIGTRQTGIILQYSGPGNYYNGIDHVDYPDGAWTPCYSRGNFGNNYSRGGNWSGHAKHLHLRIAAGDTRNDIKTELLAVPGAEIIALPEGISGDIVKTDIDCSFSWAIFFKSAKTAMEDRLSQIEIAESTLPPITKKFLGGNIDNTIANVNDVIDTYKL